MGGIKKEEVENNLTGLKGSKDNVHITQVYQSGIRRKRLQTANSTEFYMIKLFGHVLFTLGKNQNLALTVKPYNK